MYSRNSHKQGFSLIELIAVIVVVGIISGVSATYLLPSSIFQLQASRDSVITALYHAQQRAMSQTAAVRLTTTSNIIDIRIDSNNNSIFESAESQRLGGIDYPLSLSSDINLSSVTFDFSRLGETTASTVTVTKNGNSVDVTVSASGFAY